MAAIYAHAVLKRLHVEDDLCRKASHLPSILEDDEMSGMNLVTIAEEDYRKLVAAKEALEWILQNKRLTKIISQEGGGLKIFISWSEYEECQPLIKEMIEKEEK